jgi:TRAP-type C4-dicarboxylate transport system permease small subunit
MSERKSVFDYLANMLGVFASALFGILVLNVLWGVFSRYVIGEQSRWTEEVAIYLFVWVSLFGGALAYREHGHLGFDYLYSKLPGEVRMIAAVFGTVVVALFLAIVFVGGGLALANRAYTTGQVSPAVGFPIWVYYAGIPLSGIFFLIFSLEHFIRPERPELSGDTPPEGLGILKTNNKTAEQ